MSSPTDVSPFAAATAAVLEGLLDEPPLTRAAARPPCTLRAPGSVWKPPGSRHWGCNMQGNRCPSSRSSCSTPAWSGPRPLRYPPPYGGPCPLAPPLGRPWAAAGRAAPGPPNASNEGRRPAARTRPALERMATRRGLDPEQLRTSAGCPGVLQDVGVRRRGLGGGSAPAGLWRSPSGPCCGRGAAAPLPRGCRGSIDGGSGGGGGDGDDAAASSASPGAAVTPAVNAAAPYYQDLYQSQQLPHNLDL